MNRNQVDILDMESESEIKSLGFFGGGMMAESILRVLLSKKVLEKEQISVCEVVESRREDLKNFGIHVTSDAQEMLQRSETVIIAVKPDIVKVIAKEIVKSDDNSTSGSKRLYISICAGVTLETLESFSMQKYVRVMPNQPCLVGEAASAFTMNKNCSPSDKIRVKTLLSACGVAEELQEKQMDSVTGLSGSGPAFVFMMIEAMTDGGVRNGLSRPVARKLAVQTVLGSAKMAKECEDMHPGQLRNQVESPGGTTIAGTSTLERHGFRSAVIEAVTAATQRSKELGSK